MDQLFPICIFCWCHCFATAYLESGLLLAPGQQSKGPLSQQSSIFSHNLYADRVLVRLSHEDEEDGSRRLCYDCDYETDGDLCLKPNSTLFRGAKCANQDAVCKVWHFFSTTDKERQTYYLERGCAETCQPGCTSLDDMEHRFVSCVSCCTDNLCNEDDAAASVSFSAYVALFVACVHFGLSYKGFRS